MKGISDGLNSPVKEVRYFLDEPSLMAQSDDFGSISHPLRQVGGGSDLKQGSVFFSTQVSFKSCFHFPLHS
jgi:hypothetical protein